MVSYDTDLLAAAAGREGAGCYNNVVMQDLTVYWYVETGN